MDGRLGGDIMIQENINLEIVAIGSDDGINTYEIRRKSGNSGKKSLVIELYPTISTDRASCMDLSTMHLMNHAGELGWCDIRIVNLYSTVFNGKPRVSELSEAETSMAYIEEILEEYDISEYDIVIAWGSALATHKPTINLKIDILSMLKEKGLENVVKCISSDNMYVEEAYGVHPLFLGLHYGKDEWQLIDYPIDDELKKLNDNLRVVHTEATKEKKGRKKNVSKVKECA